MLPKRSSPAPSHALRSPQQPGFRKPTLSSPDASASDAAAIDASTIRSNRPVTAATSNTSTTAPANATATATAGAGATSVPQFKPSPFEDEDDTSMAAVCSELQKTLAEVELNASRGDPVFSAAHMQALEDLRAKQLALAQAWARSEVDEVVEEDIAANTTAKTAALSKMHSISGGEKEPLPEIPAATASPKNIRHNLAEGAGHKRQTSGQQTKPTTENTEDKEDEDTKATRELDEKTKKDLTLARKRREANDRYFSRVNNGVTDVVANLEHVARAMRNAERESRRIWGDNDDEESREEVSPMGSPHE